MVPFVTDDELVRFFNFVRLKDREGTPKASKELLEVELKTAQAVLEAFPDRHRQALVDQARGRGEAVQEVEAEAAGAKAVVDDRTLRVEALQVAEREIGDECDEIEASDEGLLFFRAKAEAASRAAEV